MYPQGGLWDLGYPQYQTFPSVHTNVDSSAVATLQPRANQTRQAFVILLAEEALTCVYSLLKANSALDLNFSQVCSVSEVPKDSLAPIPEKTPAFNAGVDARAFCEFHCFPDPERNRTHTILAAKLALSTPSHPEAFCFPNDVESLSATISNCLKSPDPIDQSLVLRAARIATQWLRECFGDENMPKPVATEATNERRGSGKGNQTVETRAENTGSNAPATAFHCNGCRKAMKVQAFRIRCAECDDFDLCETCFCAGIEVQGHVRSHYYIPVGPNQFPLFNAQWTADEELLLLDAVGKFGFGNWHDVAEFVAAGTAASAPIKDKEACERRYFEFHLAKADTSGQGSLYPFSSLLRAPAYSQWRQFLTAMANCPEEKASASAPDDNSEKNTAVEHPSAQIRPAGMAEVDEPVESDKVKPKECLILDPPTLPPKTHILGFLPYRGDFEQEWDNNAEYAIADMDIRDDESPMEKEAKLKILEYYNCVLDERMRRKRLMIEKRLFDKKWHDQHERLRTPEERKLHQLLTPMWKHTQSSTSDCPPPLFNPERKLRPAAPALSDHDLDEFINLVLEERALSDRLNLLTSWHQAGLKSLSEVLERGGGFVQVEKAVKDEKRGKDSSHSASTMDDLRAIDAGEDDTANALEQCFCDEAGIRTDEFYNLVKNVLVTNVSSAVLAGSLEIDGDMGRKLVTLMEGEPLEINDFMLRAKLEKPEGPSEVTGLGQNSGSTTAIPKKKRQTGKSEVTREDSPAAPEPSPLTSEAALCPSPPSEPLDGDIEAEEGEIEEEDEDSQLQLSGGPPPLPQQFGYGPKRRVGEVPIGRSGKGEKRQRRGSGGLGLAQSADVVEALSGGDDEDYALDDDQSLLSQKKSVSSNVAAGSDDELISEEQTPPEEGEDREVPDVP